MTSQNNTWDQVSAHKDAVSLFQRYANGGDDQQAKDWASATLPTLQHHLEMAQNLDKQLAWPKKSKGVSWYIHMRFKAVRRRSSLWSIGDEFCPTQLRALS